MRVLSASNPRYSENGVDLDVHFEGIGVVPFCASQDDVEQIGRELYARAMYGEFGTIAPYIPPLPTIPQSITPRQGKLALLDAGMYSAVTAAIEAMGGGAGIRAKITWESATEFRRNDPVLCSLAASLGLTDAQIDQLFIHGATL